MPTVFEATTIHYLKFKTLSSPDLRICGFCANHSPVWCWPKLHGLVHYSRTSGSASPKTWRHSPDCQKKNGWCRTLCSGCCHDPRPCPSFGAWLPTASWFGWAEATERQGQKEHQNSRFQMLATWHHQPRCFHLPFQLESGGLATPTKTFCLQPSTAPMAGAISFGPGHSVMGGSKQDQARGFDIQCWPQWVRWWPIGWWRSSCTNWHVTCARKKWHSKLLWFKLNFNGSLSTPWRKPCADESIFLASDDEDRKSQVMLLDSHWFFLCFYFGEYSSLLHISSHPLQYVLLTTCSKSHIVTQAITVWMRPEESESEIMQASEDDAPKDTALPECPLRSISAPWYGVWVLRLEPLIFGCPTNEDSSNRKFN